MWQVISGHPIVLRKGIEPQHCSFHEMDQHEQWYVAEW